ncbi:hypothetical protein G7Y89_g1983 [Cudoniella acicularis]|uniref:Uncharacterized protein n=1 Tax=Cudoniella acicularis TaxID=354080 RepID=A0A8H4W6W8_9HELO|nr:hypothetical protein G7Y89_g1983 [Cudoniella acicularis]
MSLAETESVFSKSVQGQDCTVIQPIPCDITQQNATLHPDNLLKTTALSATLPTCGTNCCPFGYSCNGTVCEQNAAQNVAPGTSPSATSTIVPASSSSPESTSSPSTLTSSCSKFPVSAILAGFFSGLVVGIILTIASICLLGVHRREGSSSHHRRRSGSSFGNISEPQPNLNSGDMRSDFLRKPPQTPSTTAAGTPSRSGTVNRVRSLFRKSTSPSQNSGGMGASMMSESPRVAPPLPLNMQRSAAPVARPVTPRLQREPSYEDINIFADGDTASALRERQLTSGNGLAPRALDNRISHQTTFTDMMHESGLAGLQKGQPYVYKASTTTSPSFSPPPRSHSPRSK